MYVSISFPTSWWSEKNTWLEKVANWGFPVLRDGFEGCLGSNVPITWKHAKHLQQDVALLILQRARSTATCNSQISVAFDYKPPFKSPARLCNYMQGTQHQCPKHVVRTTTSHTQRSQSTQADLAKNAHSHLLQDFQQNIVAFIRDLQSQVPQATTKVVFRAAVLSHLRGQAGNQTKRGKLLEKVEKCDCFLSFEL